MSQGIQSRTQLCFLRDRTPSATVSASAWPDSEAMGSARHTVRMRDGGHPAKGCLPIGPGVRNSERTIRYRAANLKLLSEVFNAQVADHSGNDGNSEVGDRKNILKREG
jgi:hypothetical protein